MVFVNGVPYMQISNIIPVVNTIDGKVSLESINGAGGFVGILRPQQGFYGAKHPMEIFSL